jgi:hypothetical protein
MISITIEFKGFFARLAKQKELSLVLRDGTSMIEMLQSVAGSFKQEHRELVMDALVSREGMKCDHATRVHDGDRFIFLVPVIGGG